MSSRMPALTATTAVAAAQLLRLPRAHRLERVRGHDVWHAPEERREVAGHVGVPGVRVDEVGSNAVAGHADVDAEGLHRGVTGRELGEIGVRRRPVLVTRGAEAAHPDVDVAAVAERPDELCHVNTRASVDGRRVLLAEDVDAHVPTLVLQSSRGAESSADLAC